MLHVLFLDPRGMGIDFNQQNQAPPLIPWSNEKNMKVKLKGKQANTVLSSEYQIPGMMGFTFSFCARELNIT